MTCAACGATLQGDAALEIPGLTALDGQHAWRAAAPRKVRRTLGGLFAGGDQKAMTFVTVSRRLGSPTITASFLTPQKHFDRSCEASQ